MRWTLPLVSLSAAFLTVGLALAGEAPLALATATGSVETAEKDTLTVQSRGANGQFGKKLVLKVTGTTKISIVTQEKRAGKMVAVQHDAHAKDLEAGQHVAVVYTGTAAEAVLLSAVAQKAMPK